MVYIYGADVSCLPDPKEQPEIMRGLPEERKNKIMRYMYSSDRRESLGAGLLLNYVLEHHGLSGVQISYGENGKPLAEEVCFNLSHSHEFVICAIGREPVGCDAEKIGTAPEQVAGRFFCDSEIRHLNSYEGTQRNREFYRLWTIKESYMKLTGEGMKLPLDQFEVLPGDEVQIRRDGEIVSCHIKEYDVLGYKVTVCANEAEFEEYIDVTEQISF